MCPLLPLCQAVHCEEEKHFKIYKGLLAMHRGVLRLPHALKSNLIYSCQRGLLEEMKGRGRGGRIH